MTTKRIRFSYLTGVLILAAIIPLTGCQNILGDDGDTPAVSDDNSGDNGDDNQSSAAMTIRGSLAGVSASVSASGGVGAAALPGEIESVLLLYQRGQYVEADVASDGSFELPVSETTPTGILLIGADQSFQGYTTFGGGSSVIPLQVADDEVTTMDLGTIQVGEDAAPAELDVDAHLGIDPADRNIMDASAAFFEAMIRNPDANGNGVVDALEEFFVQAHVQFNIHDISFVDGALAATNTYTAEDGELPVKMPGHNLYVGVTDGRYTPEQWREFVYANPQATLSVPAAHNSGNSSLAAVESNEVFGFPQEDQTGMPAAGDYRLSVDVSGSDLGYEEISYEYTIPESAANGESVIVYLPEVSVDESGIIGEIALPAHDLQENPVARPGVVLDYMYLMITIAPDHWDEYEGELEIQVEGEDEYRYFYSGNLPGSTAQYTPGIDIAWEHVTKIAIFSTDHFGHQTEQTTEKISSGSGDATGQ